MTTHLPLEEIVPGKTLPVTVIGIAKTGIIVQVDNTEYTAFIHVSKIARGYVENIADYISVGERYDAMGYDKGFKPELVLTHLNLKPKHRNSSEQVQKKPVPKKPEIPEQYTPKQHTPKSLDQMIEDANKSFKDKYVARELKNRLRHKSNVRRRKDS